MLFAICRTVINPLKSDLLKKKKLQIKIIKAAAVTLIIVVPITIIRVHLITIKNHSSNSNNNSFLKSLHKLHSKTNSHFVTNTWRRRVCATIIHTLVKLNTRSQKDSWPYPMECLPRIIICKDMGSIHMGRINFKVRLLEAPHPLLVCQANNLLILMTWVKTKETTQIKLNLKDLRNLIYLFFTYLMIGRKVT